MERPVCGVVKSWSVVQGLPRPRFNRGLVMTVKLKGEKTYTILKTTLYCLCERSEAIPALSMFAELVEAIDTSLIGE